MSKDNTSKGQTTLVSIVDCLHYCLVVAPAPVVAPASASAPAPASALASVPVVVVAAADFLCVVVKPQHPLF